MHPIYWFLVIGFGIYLLRLVRALRNAVARLG
jgi:hypothetical protein